MKNFYITILVDGKKTIVKLSGSGFHAYFSTKINGEAIQVLEVDGWPATTVNGPLGKEFPNLIKVSRRRSSKKYGAPVVFDKVFG